MDNQIYERLRGKYWLLPLSTSVYSIPERLKEYDSSLFLVFNTRKQAYEVHSLAQIGDTYGFDVPQKEPDARVLRYAERNNVKTRGKKLLREIERNFELAERSSEREAQNYREAIAREMHPYFRDLAWS